MTTLPAAIISSPYLPFKNSAGEDVHCVRTESYWFVSESAAKRLEESSEVQVHRGPVPRSLFPLKLDPLPLPEEPVEAPGLFHWPHIIPKPLPILSVVHAPIPEPPTMTILDLAAAFSRAIGVPFRVNRISATHAGSVVIDVSGMPHKRELAIYTTARLRLPASVCVITTRESKW